MSRFKKFLKKNVIPNTAVRRLRTTPNYFFIIWRWSMWFYALVIIIFFILLHGGGHYYVQANSTLSRLDMAILLLTITFIQTVVVTLYAPVIRVFLPHFFSQDRRNTQQQKRKRKRALTEDDYPEIVPALMKTRNPYWDVVIYGLDVLICGLVTYYSGPFTDPPFGVGSPFYRYGLSTIFAAGLAYRYRGALAAAFGYDLIVALGMIIPAPGAPLPPHQYVPNLIDIVGCLLDAPVAAVLTAFIATLLANYARSKKREQDNVRRQKYLVRVGQTLLKGTNDRQELLQRSATQILQGGHFDRLVIALIENSGEEDGKQREMTVSTCVEAIAQGEGLSPIEDERVMQVLQSRETLVTFELLQGEENQGYGLARFYLPLRKDGQIHIIIGAESRRTTPFGERQTEFLTIIGPQLLVALDNIRLTEQLMQLAATAERGRIAREIHDGIAQLIYMLSLNAETCQAQAYRIAEATQEDAELMTPLAERLGKLVTIAKQALWETRNYMFSLKPMISGTTTLTQMLTNQVKEFETISTIPTRLIIDGEEEFPREKREAARYAQIGTALFRIVQEALSNAYKHAEATQITVRLHFSRENVKVEIYDDGKGLPETYVIGEEQRFSYSGHGIRGMRERAKELGGAVELLPQTGCGLMVHVCIPL